MAATSQSSFNKSENLGNCPVENRYFVGYLDGKRDDFEDSLFDQKRMSIFNT